MPITLSSHLEKTNSNYVVKICELNKVLPCLVVGCTVYEQLIFILVFSETTFKYVSLVIEKRRISQFS